MSQQGSLHDVPSLATSLATSDASGQETYTAADIELLTGLTPIRRRPGMYIGDTTDGSGLLNMLEEVLGRALWDGARRVTVTLEADGSVAVQDDGAGSLALPAREQRGMPACSQAEQECLHLFCGTRTWWQRYGLGLAPINALSTTLVANVVRDRIEYRIEFASANLVSAGLIVVGPARKNDFSRGTIIRYRPDPAIFAPVAMLDGRLVAERLQTLAFLLPGVHVDLVDRTSGSEDKLSFHAVGGLVDYVRHLDAWRRSVSVPIAMSSARVAEGCGDDDAIEVDVALAWNEGDATDIRGYTNHEHQPEGGAHVEGLERAVCAVLVKDGRRHPFAPLAGLTAVVSVRMSNPHYAGATRRRLGGARVRDAVERCVKDGLTAWLAADRQRTESLFQRLAARD